MPISSQASDIQKRLDDLREASCPSDTSSFPFANLDISISEAVLGRTEDIKAALPDQVSFIGGWHLTTTTEHFGGLSGIDILPNGDLLAVSDRGYVFTIGMSDFTPNGTGTMTPLLDQSGKQLIGKNEVDAEGLAYYDGLTFVSFERNHRILAYNLFLCGAASRGAKVISLPKTLLGKKVPSNNSAEALKIDRDGHLIVGFEIKTKGRSPLLHIPLTNETVDQPQVKTLSSPELFSLVGMSKSAILLRAYDKKTGNQNIIRLKDKGIEFTLAPPLNVDNFEGITETATPDGRHRIYLISDDNFSKRQRTLLYVFEIDTK